MKFGLNNIKKAYSLLKKQALNKYAEGDFNGCVQRINQCTILPSQFNWIYCDDDFETILSEMSSQLFLSQKTSTYIPEENKVVLIDDFCRSFILALQYIEALTNANFQVLYITCTECTKPEERSIISKLQSYKNVTCLILEKKLYVERSKDIYNSIIDFKASKVFLHIKECSDSLLALYSLPTEIKRYMINLGDQRFWIGAQAIDYSLEFRPFGTTVSLEKRGLKKEQLLYVPFYPINDKHVFQGFPKIAEGKVVVFTGGDFYKTLDPNYTYWELIKKILNQNPEAIVLFAIKHNIGPKTNEFVKKFISDNQFENRFISIGFRNDICEVFKHSDIYLGTCPTSGSLMSQLAALYSKPILQFYLPNTSDDETEQALCYNKNISISFRDEESFLREAKKLIDSKEYRLKSGNTLHESMLKPEQFNVRLIEKISTHDCSDCEVMFVNHDKITERWLFAEQMGYMNTYSFVRSLLGDKVMFENFTLLWFVNKISNLFNKILKHNK